MIPKLKRVIVCPMCKSDLEFYDSKISCPNCKVNYKLVGGVPVFIKGKLFKNQSSRNAVLKTLSGLFIYKNKKTIDIVEKLIEKYKNKIILNIGSGETDYKNSINMDIGLFKNVNLVANAHNLPIRKNSIDLIISYHVLEHLKNPQQAVDEFYRVLRPGGKVFIEVPFIQRFHGYPNDYYRFTLFGLRNITSKFRGISYGTAGGPVAALSELTVNFIRFSANNLMIRLIFLAFSLPIFFTLKFSDSHLIKNKESYKLASGVYFVGEK